jgi:hypothetical protein
VSREPVSREPVSREPVSRGRLAGRVALLLSPLLVMALGSLFLVAVLLVPFEPLSVYGYEAVPGRVCPGERVAVYVDQRLRDGYAVRSMEVEAAWEAVAAAGYEPGQRAFAGRTTLLRPEPGPREVVESAVLRDAPETPGEWRIVGEVEVRGSRFGVPNVQEVRVESEKTTTVLAPSSPGCR